MTERNDVLESTLADRQTPEKGFDYCGVFRAIEAKLIANIEQSPARESIRKELESYKGFEQLSDGAAFRKLVMVVFYSGFRAQTVTDRKDVLHKHFPDHRTSAMYVDADVAQILADARMIRNERKVRACIENAREMVAIASRFGSFMSYVDSFDPHHSLEGLLLLKEELEARFAMLGGVTVYHLLTDLGLPVLKPDRVVCRLFHRLGLIDNQTQLLKTVLQGRRFAHVTGLPIRYIDAVLVAFGQVSAKDLGVRRGICLDQPRCGVCPVREHCQHLREKSQFAETGAV